MESDPENQPQNKITKSEISKKSPEPLLEFCKKALFKQFYNGLISIKKTHQSFNAIFAKLPNELKENIINYFNQQQTFGFRHATWDTIQTINLHPEDCDTLQSNFTNLDFPFGTEYYTCSPNQAWIAFSSIHATTLKKFDSQSNQWVLAQVIGHDILPQKICFSLDSKRLTFEFPDTILVLKQINEQFPISGVIELSKSMYCIKSLIGFSQDNHLITHHSHYARLDFRDSTQSEVPLVYSMYFPKLTSEEHDSNAQLFIPSLSGFYYLNDANELYTTNYALDFAQITVKLALEKYSKDKNIHKLYKLKKPVILQAFEGINKHLMQKYIGDAFEMVKNGIVTHALQKMAKYKAANDVTKLQTLLHTLFPKKYQKRDYALAIKACLLKSAQTTLIDDSNDPLYHDEFLLNHPFLTLFKKKKSIESCEITTIKSEILEKIRSKAFDCAKKLKNKNNNKATIQFFNTTGFQLLEQEDQKKLITASGLATMVPFKKPENISESKGLLDLFEPTFNNPHILSRGKDITCAA